MKQLLRTAAIAAAFSLTGCMTVHNGDQVFAITAQKFIIGKSIADAEAKIPPGATVLHVQVAKGPILGLIQTSYIAGTK